MRPADFGNLAVTARRGWFAPAVLLAFAALGWTEEAEVAPAASEGEHSAETAPAGGVEVEDADEADAEPTGQPEEEAPEPEPKSTPKKDGPQDVFVPSENLSEDISVPFPVDI